MAATKSRRLNGLTADNHRLGGTKGGGTTRFIFAGRGNVNKRRGTLGRLCCPSVLLPGVNVRIDVLAFGRSAALRRPSRVKQSLGEMTPTGLEPVLPA